MVILIACIWLGWLTWTALHISYFIASLVGIFLPYALWGVWLAIRNWRRSALPVR